MTNKLISTMMIDTAYLIFRFTCHFTFYLLYHQPSFAKAWSQKGLDTLARDNAILKTQHCARKERCAGSNSMAKKWLQWSIMQKEECCSMKLLLKSMHSNNDFMIIKAARKLKKKITSTPCVNWVLLWLDWQVGHKLMFHRSCSLLKLKELSSLNQEQ